MVAGLSSADYYFALEVLAATVALLIFLSSVDDLFIDIWYWLRRIFRYFTAGRQYPHLTVQQIREKNEQSIAIMVPVWHEYDVIAAMVENMVEVMEYKNYIIFVGIYMNDPRTIDEVERMRRRYKQLCRVEVPHEKPTCKADCLNSVVGVQPFGGEGLSDTGPKAGGPHCLLRFCTEQTVTVNTTAAGGECGVAGGLRLSGEASIKSAVASVSRLASVWDRWVLRCGAEDRFNGSFTTLGWA